MPEASDLNQIKTIANSLVGLSLVTCGELSFFA
jgi:hypothetical protein